jgi:hypothetical protein
MKTQPDQSGDANVSKNSVLDVYSTQISEPLKRLLNNLKVLRVKNAKLKEPNLEMAFINTFCFF